MTATVVSTNHVRFTTPAHRAGSVSVVVGTENGSATLAFRYVDGDTALVSTGADIALPAASGAVALLAGAAPVLSSHGITDLNGY